MKRNINLLLIMLVGLILFACESDKTYDGPAQIAFGNKTAAFTVEEDMAIVIPVQLIANIPQGDVTANVSVNTSSTCASAVNVPTSVTIPKGRFAGEISVTVSYNSLAAGNTNKLVLDLASTGVKVAANYATVTVTITKK